MAVKVLVTGGTGFLGSALVRRLLQENHHVRVLDNDQRGSIGRLQDVRKDIEFIAADIRDAEAVQKACKGIERICHLAFVNGTEFFYSMPEVVLDVGVSGMVNILKGAVAAGVGEFFLASSSEVYQVPETIPTDESAALSIPDPLNPRYSYAGGKIVSELMAINFGRKHFSRTVIFRPHNVYGPQMGQEHVIPQFVLRMKELCKQESKSPLPFPIQGTGKETRAFVFIDDFISGLQTLLEKGKHLNIYHVGNDEEISIAEVAKEVGKYFGKKVQVKAGSLQQGSAPRRCPDIRKIKALGYAPQVPFTQGLALTAKWYDEHATEMKNHG